jgi:hypothetical protein
MMLDGLGHFVNCRACSLSGGDEIEIVQEGKQTLPGMQIACGRLQPAMLTGGIQCRH